MTKKNAYALAGARIPYAEVFKNAADETEFTMYDGQKRTKGEIVYIAPYYNQTDPFTEKENIFVIKIPLK